jgi:hypothetical protein
MPFCPECRDEFVAGATACPDCECDLVDDLSAVPARSEEEIPEDTTPAGTAGTLPDERAAEAVVQALLAVSIPARVGPEGREGYPVEVPEDFLPRATAMLRRLAEEPVEEISEEDRERLAAPMSELMREGPAAVASLTRLLVRGSGEVLHHAAARLARLGGEGLDALRGALVEAVSAEADGIRRAAVRALVQNGRTEMPEALGELTRSPEPGVRQRAARTMAALGSTTGLPHIVRLLRDGEAEVREEAADAIWEMTGGRFDLEFEEDPESAEATIRELEERYGG